jgi:ATP-dependent DNA helicase Q1
MLRENLKSTFKIDDFRSQQLETLNATLSKHDTILVAPTGGGKSLTYQLSAVVDPGITLVVSPLIALMEDQLNSLKKRNIPAEMLSMSSTKEVVDQVHKIMQDPSMRTGDKLKILYVTPERMSKSKRFMTALQKCYQSGKLDRIAIDEVHCCSVMGHDFRPDYKFLGTLKSLFPKTPILGVTATASKKVIIDVQKILNIRGCIIFNSSFNRPNLYYHVLEKPSNNEDVYDLLSDLLTNRYKGQSGIIYTFSIKDTETLVSELLQRDCKVRPYHAQLDTKQRSGIYQKWMNNQIQAVVATIAFGLGIDKPDVSFVIHHTLSKSMENFYQESGRCGRDGTYAESILLFRLSDMFKISSMTFLETNGHRNAYSMIEYCINSKTCRRDQFGKYFTEVWNDKSCGKMCDCCFNRTERRCVVPPKLDIMKHYKTLVRIIEKAHASDVRLTALKLLDSWYQKGAKNLRLDDVDAPNIDRFYGEQILAHLIINDYLREDIQFTAYSTFSYIIKGPRNLCDEHEYAPSRVYELPKIDEMKYYYETISKAVLKPSTSLISIASSTTSVTSAKRKHSESENEAVAKKELKTEGTDDDVIIVDCKDEIINID